MDQLLSMTVFCQVVDRGSFSGAARKLRLSNAAVSKHVAALEEHVGVRLLNRTTRRLSLTREGEVYYADGARLLAALGDLDNSVRGAAGGVRGRLRINAPLSFGVTQLVPLLPEISTLHPDLELDISLTDRVVDLLAEGVDVALRIATELGDSSVVAARLAPVRRVVCTSPGYLAARGRPRTPEDLASGKHACLLYGGHTDPAHWPLRRAGKVTGVRVHSRLHIDNSMALRDLLLADAGIALVPTFIVAAELAAGRLVTVLDEWEPVGHSLHVLYPQARYLTARVRFLVDFLRVRFADAPWDAAWQKKQRRKTQR